MKFTNWIKSKFRRDKKFSGERRIIVRAGYHGANINRLTSDMVIYPVSADSDIRWSLKILRARMRDLAINNDYLRKYLWMVATNVVGPNGIKFQSKLRDKSGKLDKNRNTERENLFQEWGKKENCTVTGLLGWNSVQRQVIQTVARDGEVFIRFIRGFPNKFNFAIQILEADYVDEGLNNIEKRIRMGIEYDEWRKPIAYHFLKYNVVDYQTRNQKEYIRVPASDVLHLFIQDRPEQGRGVPWGHTAIYRLGLVDGYEENELVASRCAAGKMGFYETAGEYSTGEKENGSPIQAIEPGVFEVLPPGTKFIPYDPQHPTTAYSSFMKTCLRGISSGLLVSYNAIANDLEGVNYSSIRQGVLDERDIWRTLQQWFIEGFCDPIFREFEKMMIMAGKMKRDDQVNSVKWQPRGWAWVDPEKDQTANIIGINAGLNTRTRALGEEGLDIEDVLDELAEEKRLAEEKGLDITPTTRPKVAEEKTAVDSEPKVKKFITVR